MRVLQVALCVAIVVGVLGCQQEGQQADRLIGWAEEPPGVQPPVVRSPAVPPVPRPDSGPMVSGVIRRIRLEGGFYGIITEDGRRLNPVNLPDTFKRDGLRVHVRVEKVPERASIYMWGDLVRIVEIEPA